MPVLLRKINYRNIRLTDPPENRDPVGVYLKGGGIRYLPWRGFIDVYAARAAGAVPVVLDAVALVASDEIGAPRYELQANERVQGAVIEGEVFGVTANGSPRVVRIPRQPPSAV